MRRRPPRAFRSSGRRRALGQRPDRAVFHGDPGERRFIAFWLTGDRVVAGMSVNVWNAIDSVRALVESGASPADASPSDPDVPLDSLLPCRPPRR
ncbi:MULTISPECIES: oxidoreductase C-terminal domain-containing protein [unclassified Streptomyces]|uniref:oxidoreductase C-terminal domain-containing protein n=1 Tax=unclassified Streptomyces TaxID=2593676 RepID=UPI002473B5E7|nr:MULTISPECIES: oxidoreductase C-terminal domain-containing protein [unclassified Streptomyces]